MLSIFEAIYFCPPIQNFIYENISSFERYGRVTYKDFEQGLLERK